MSRTQVAVQVVDAFRIVHPAVLAHGVLEGGAVLGYVDRRGVVVAIYAREDLVQPTSVDLPAHLGRGKASADVDHIAAADPGRVGLGDVAFAHGSHHLGRV